MSGSHFGHKWRRRLKRRALAVVVLLIVVVMLLSLILYPVLNPIRNLLHPTAVF